MLSSLAKLEKNGDRVSIGALLRQLADLSFDHGRITTNGGATTANRLLKLAATVAPTDQLCNPSSDADKADLALALGGSAVGVCAEAGKLASCPYDETIQKLVERICPGAPDVLLEVSGIAARIGSSIGVALVARKPDESAKGVIDAAFTYFCRRLDFANGCDDPPPSLAVATAAPADANAALKQKARSLRALLLAIADRDTPRLIVKAAALVKLEVLDPKLHRDHLRALRFLGGLLDYTLTFDTSAALAPAGGDQPKPDQHQARRAVLESLTRDMTDRTGRAGDNILSLGGALRFVGGPRFAAGHTVLYGPLSLPLGAALDLYSDDALHGLHLQIDVVDLGQFLSWDESWKVRDFELAAALAPGVTVGWAWGGSLPFVVGLTGGYVPRFVVQQNPSHLGAWQFGVTAGIAVPLIDIN
jgi:hypothetical protein